MAMQKELQMKKISVEAGGTTKTVGVLKTTPPAPVYQRWAGATSIDMCYGGKVPLIESLQFIRDAEEGGAGRLQLVSHEVADALLIGGAWVQVMDAFPTPVRQIVAYERAGTKLGDEIFCRGDLNNVVLPTGRYKGEGRIALVVPDITADEIEQDGNLYRIKVSDDRLIAVPDFPDRSGWYLPHPATGIPHGNRFDDPSFTGENQHTLYSTQRGIFREGMPLDIRHLSRSGESYVGLPVRSHVDCQPLNIVGGYNRNVFLDVDPGCFVAILVEVKNG